MLKSIREKKITDDPTQNVKNIPRQTPKQVHLDETEVEMLYNTDCEDIDLKYAFLFGCYTSIRLSDIRDLKWTNIQGERINYTQKKTGDYQDHPLTSSAIKILEKVKELHDNPNGSEKIFNLGTELQICRRLKVWSEKAGITKHVTFHVSRHTFATWAHDIGVDIYTIKKLMGHRSIRTTEIYSHMTDKKKKEAVNSFPDLIK